MDIQGRKTAVALLSVVSNTTLVLLKLAVGLMIGSVSVISEAIHSGVDLVAALIAWFAVRTSGRPADREHPFGHGKVENVSGTVEALLIFLAAGWIIVEAVRKLHITRDAVTGAFHMSPQPLEHASWGVAVMLLSAVANTIVSHWLFKVGKETDSVALQADGWHLRTDVYTSVGVMVGMALLWFHESLLPKVNLDWIDSAAAMVVAALIIKAAYELTMESARDLLDVSLPLEEQQWVRDYVVSLYPEVRGYHGFKTRKAGSSRFIEFHILVDPDMTVADSHDITERATDHVRDRFPDTQVTIHVEPCAGQCTEKCTSGCLVDKRLRGAG